MDSLDADQRRALSQLREITEGTDEEVAMSVLSSVGWDVQVRRWRLESSQLPPMAVLTFQDRRLQSSFLGLTPSHHGWKDSRWTTPCKERIRLPLHRE